MYYIERTFNIVLIVRIITFILTVIKSTCRVDHSILFSFAISSWNELLCRVLTSRGFSDENMYYNFVNNLLIYPCIAVFIQ